ncbi:pentapeptide repeat-containing protein [Cyanobacteria bacterium FACHB-DQ100]|nr:pentapeptide repeat-containing protein [Cyanobacteria bacterium FACHB-DQ100]
MSVDPNLPASNTTNGSAVSITPTRAEVSRERTASHLASSQSGSSPPNPSRAIILIVALLIVSIGLFLNQFWLILAGSIVTLLFSAQMLYPTVKPVLIEILTEQDQGITLGVIGAVVGLIGIAKIFGADQAIAQLYRALDWDAVGALGEVFGALGQILIAILAVYIAWRQYIISIELTVQQNTITQQQTIDTYFQGISDLVLDEEGLLEDWPQERAIAEGRTAAILSSVDGAGKAKIIRFLSRAKLLSPLKRDARLGRAILNGTGGYAEDRVNGIRVIDLGIMLAAADLSGTDLRWADLSEANLIRANLANCDLVKTNFARTVLCSASLRGADLSGTRFFYGKAETASPRSRTEPPNFKTGAYTGAVIENADFTDAEDMSEEQRYYCCAWGGSTTRSTIPGGCEGIPNKLGR